jgi:hypothetical protein
MMRVGVDGAGDGEVGDPFLPQPNEAAPSTTRVEATTRM